MRISRSERLTRASSCPARSARTRASASSSRAATGRREINAALVHAGVAVSRLEPVRHSLEQRFLEITSRLDADLIPGGGRGDERHHRRPDGGRGLPEAPQEARHLIWALVLALAPLLIFFIVKALQHSSNPTAHGPAGGTSGFIDGLRVLAVFFGPLAAIMIGTDGGAGDPSAGVFRDLVVTGRSRLALFGSRVPAALGVCWVVITIAYVVVVIGTYALASGLHPDGRPDHQRLPVHAVLDGRAVHRCGGLLIARRLTGRRI